MVAESYKKLRCPQIKQNVYRYSELLSNFKKKCPGILTHATPATSLDDIVVSETNQTEKWFLLDKVPEIGKLIERK